MSRKRRKMKKKLKYVEKKNCFYRDIYGTMRKVNIRRTAKKNGIRTKTLPIGR